MRAGTGHRHAFMSLAALCIMCGVYTGIVFNTITLYMDPIIREFPDITRTQFAMIITLAGGANAVLSLFVFGPMVERLKLKKCILLGAVSVCAALLFFANIRGLTQMYLGGLLLGFGITFGAAGAASVGINEWFAGKRATMLSIPIACGFVSGIVFSPMAGGWIETAGWRTSFYIALAVTAAGSLLVAALYRDSPGQVGELPVFYGEEQEKSGEEDARTKRKETGVTFRGMFRTRQFYCLCGSYLIAGVVIYSVMSNMAIFSADHGFAPVAQGTVLSVMFAATAATMVPAGMISDRLGTRVTMSVCFAALILALFILMQDDMPDFMVYIAAALAGIAYVGTNGPASVSVEEGLGTREFNKKMPVILGFMFVGVSLGNPLLQLFYDITRSYSPGFRVYIILAVIGLVLIYPGTRPAGAGNRKGSLQNTEQEKGV